jgi:hypothetical protein
VGFNLRSELLVSERLYAALLYLYPKDFRATYGQQMRLTFRDACRVAYRRHGTGGLLALWLPTLLDLLKSALEERARQGEIALSKARLIALAGPLTILVGSIWLVEPIGDLLLRFGQVRAERFWDLFLAFWSFAFILSFVPLLFALMGTRLRFYPSASTLGRLGLVLSVVGGAGVIASMLAHLLLGAVAPEPEVGEVPWIGYAAVASFWSVWIGYILFGVDTLRYRLLPRWNLLPGLLGATIVLSFGFEWFGVPALLPLQWITPSLFIFINGTCLVLLGLALKDPRRELSTPAASAV